MLVTLLVIYFFSLVGSTLWYTILFSAGHLPGCIFFTYFIFGLIEGPLRIPLQATYDNLFAFNLISTHVQLTLSIIQNNIVWKQKNIYPHVSYSSFSFNIHIYILLNSDHIQSGYSSQARSQKRHWNGYRWCRNFSFNQVSSFELIYFLGGFNTAFLLSLHDFVYVEL